MAGVDAEIRQERANAAYPAGVEGGVHTLHRSGPVVDIDSRTHDKHVQQLVNLRSGWKTEVGAMVDRWRDDYQRVNGTPAPAVSGS
jgi:hypothetical protein